MLMQEQVRGSNNTQSAVASRLAALGTVMVRQRKELAELFQFETRNKYAVETADGEPVAFVAEQQKSLLGFALRQIVGHWRSFELHLFNAERKLEYVATHPFRWYYQRIELRKVTGELVGTVDRRFEIFGKRFDISDADGQLLFSVRSPLWRIFTFPFKRDDAELGSVTKKWGGVLTELLTDADTFEVKFAESSLSPEARLMILISAVFIDLQYFERKE